jgi:hypothetical protein
LAGRSWVVKKFRSPYSVGSSRLTVLNSYTFIGGKRCPDDSDICHIQDSERNKREFSKMTHDSRGGDPTQSREVTLTSDSQVGKSTMN